MRRCSAGAKAVRVTLKRIAATLLRSEQRVNRNDVLGLLQRRQPQFERQVQTGAVCSVFSNSISRHTSRACCPPSE